MGENNGEQKEDTMISGTNSGCAQVTTTTRPRLRRSMVMLLALAAVAVGVPTPALADERARLEGTFSVLYTYPSAVNYCAAGAGEGNVSIEAQGLGNISGVGPLFLTVKKCFTFADGTYEGRFTMSAGTGHAATGTYEGTQGALDENGFGPFNGVLTVTGGTGRFRHARGRLTFEAVAGPDSVGAGAVPTLNGTAFYLIRESAPRD